MAMMSIHTNIHIINYPEKKDVNFAFHHGFHAAGSQNILLSTLAWQDALNFLRKAKGLGIESDAITFNSIMEDLLSLSLLVLLVSCREMTCKFTSWALSASTLPLFKSV